MLRSRGRARRRGCRAGRCWPSPPRPGSRNAIEMRSKRLGCSRHDVVGRPTPHRDRVDPGDDRRRQDDPRERLEELHEEEADRGQREQLRDVEERAQPREVEQDGEQRRAPTASGSTRARRSRAGSASQRHGERDAAARRARRRRTSGQRPSSGSTPAPASHATSSATSTAASAAPRRGAQYGGSCAHHGPSALKAFQKAVFAACSSSASSMSGVTSASIVGVKRRSDPGLGALERVGEREGERVEEPHGLVAHHHEQLRLHDVELARRATAPPARRPPSRT